MGLLDLAKEKTSNYVSPKDFLCFLACRLEEPITNVVSFLLYNEFDKLACEYYIDSHYRIYTYDDVDCEYKTSKLFKEISKDGYHDYIGFCYKFYDDNLDNDDEELDFYEPMEIDFFYSLEELQSMSFIKELNLPLEESSTLGYSIDGNDIVTITEPRDSFKIFSYINTNVKSDAERAKEEQEVIDKHGENSQGHNFYRLIEAGLNRKLPHQQKPFKSDKEIISEYEEKIAELESELAQVKAQLREQTDKPADDLKDVPHQSYRTVDRVMYAMAKLAKRDNTEPYSQNNPSLNAAITTILQNDGLTLEYQAVGKWLSRINDIKPLK